MDAASIRDNAALARYELEVDGHTAFVTYKRRPGKITFIHTEVPKALEGRGVGSTLAKGVLDLARVHGEKVVPLCPFIAAYIRKHPEYQDLVSADYKARAE